MENHIHNFLNRYMPGLGLLRSFQCTPPADVSNDIESAQTDLMTTQIENGTTDPNTSASQAQITPSIGAENQDDIDSSAPQTTFKDTHLENEELQQPQFTEGPSRFVLANDGSKECVALLVNEEFLASLRDVSQAIRDVSALNGPLCHAKMDAKNTERSIKNIQETLETLESEGRAECQNLIEQQTSELLKIEDWKDDLERERRRIEEKLEICRSHTQWVLESAMKEADFLGPEKPLPAILFRDQEIEKSEEQTEVAGQETSSTTSVASDDEEIQVSEEELQRRAAYDDFMDRSQLLNTLQTNFDDQQDNYRENLAKFQEDVEAGTSGMTRSDFDRRSVQYGQQLTRALIEAEEGFEQAKEYAQALGAIASDYGHEFYYGAEYEESWPENKIAEYNASQDWSAIEEWMDNIPNSNNQAEIEVEIDEWDAEEVDVNDSISAIDCEEYRQDIDRYRRICARLEDPCPEVRFLGQPDERVLERRSSCWM